MALSPRDRLGPYEIDGLIGAGAMGEVYAARDVRLRRPVAIKLLPAHLIADDSRLHRFLQEARAASILNHPNIVTIYDVGEQDALRYIAMELVSGRSLRDHAGSPVPLPTVTTWGRQIASALAVAHAAGIVHRDIKPDNVMVRDDGYVKVLDFGLARMVAGEAGSHSVVATRPDTDPGTLIGTIRYMSPEQARGEPATGASDVFALGTTLYELATGRHPLQATTLLEWLTAIEHHRPLPASAVVAGIAPETDEVLARMMDKDPRRRPDAERLVAMLDAAATPSGKTGALPVPGSAHVARVRQARERVLVGRADEQAMLLRAFDNACAGRGSLVCVSGEPGIGKSSIVESVLADIAHGGTACRVSQGRCSERLAGTEAYLPWLEALESLCRREPDGNRSSGSVVAQTMRRLAPAWYDLVGVVVDDLSSPPGTQGSVRGATQERMKRELMTLLEAVTETEPLVLFFDDLHWADVSTIDLLAFIGARIGTMRLLLIATYRPADLHLSRHAFLSVKPELQARGVCHDCHLGFLSDRDVDAYLAMEFPGHRFPQALRTLIHGKTEGSPLFMADLVRHLRDRGVIARRGETWELAQSLPTIDRDLPESVRGMIERKIAQLDDDERRLLVTASVQGYRFDSAIVARAMRAEAADIEDRLGRLERVHGFIRTTGEDTLPDRSLTWRCQFVHVLYQGALYATLSPTRRATESRQVADALLATHADPRGQTATQLASLFEASRDFDRAAHYFRIAAQGASRMFANHEAAALARRGIVALESDPGVAEHGPRELELRLIVGSSLMNIRGYAATEVEQTYGEALQLARRLHDHRGLHRGLWGLALFHLARAEYARARALGLELLALGENASDDGMRVTAHYVLGSVLFYLSEIGGSREHFVQGLAVCEGTMGLRLPDGRHAVATCRAQFARVLWLAGHGDEAVRVSQSAQAMAVADGQPLIVAFALFTDMVLQQFRGDVAATHDRAVRLRALAVEHDLAQYHTWAGILLGWASSFDNAPDGIEMIVESLAAQARVGSELSRPHFLAMLADACLRQGRLAEAIDAVAEGLASGARTGERYYEAELHRLRGAITVAGSGMPDDAMTCFRASYDIATSQGAIPLALRAAIAMVKGQPDGRATPESVAALRAACAGLAEPHGFSEWDEAQALLVRIGG